MNNNNCENISRYNSYLEISYKDSQVVRCAIIDFFVNKNRLPNKISKILSNAFLAHDYQSFIKLDLVFYNRLMNEGLNYDEARWYLSSIYDDIVAFLLVYPSKN
jgi:hypothetical protein